jgi:Protein of unknown function, DUF547
MNNFTHPEPVRWLWCLGVALLFGCLRVRAFLASWAETAPRQLLLTDHTFKNLAPPNLLHRGLLAGAVHSAGSAQRVVPSLSKNVFHPEASLSWPLLRSAYYRAEKYGASKNIPSVVNIPHRSRLADVADSSGSSFDHSLWNDVLTRHVAPYRHFTFGSIQDVTAVDYACIALDQSFSQYLNALATLPEPPPPGTPDHLAFWINVYNAACIHLIVQYESVSGIAISSINDLSTSDRAVWDQPAVVVAGRSYTLNDIEHVQLRQQWNEPAIHACIVCASASCPNLRWEAFDGTSAAKLQPQMQDQMVQWLSNETKGSLMRRTKYSVELELSRIFLWFSDDFAQLEKSNGVIAYVSSLLQGGDANHADPLVSSGHGTGCPRIVRYLPYDWSINRVVRACESPALATPQPPPL